MGLDAKQSTGLLSGETMAGPVKPILAILTNALILPKGRGRSLRVWSDSKDRRGVANRAVETHQSENTWRASARGSSIWFRGR